MNTRLAPHLDAYIRFYQSGTTEGLEAVTAEDILFTDPFNTINGQAAYRRLLDHTYRSIGIPEVTVTHRAWDGDTAFIRWVFAARLRGKPWAITGMSELHFAADGRVSQHIDHWDAARQFYEHLPLIAPLLRLIRRKVAIQ